VTHDDKKGNNPTVNHIDTDKPIKQSLYNYLGIDSRYGMVITYV